MLSGVLLIKFFCRSRWRRRRRCLSSLLQLRLRRRLSCNKNYFLLAWSRLRLRLWGKRVEKSGAKTTRDWKDGEAVFRSFAFSLLARFFSSVCADRQLSTGNALIFRRQWKKKKNKRETSLRSRRLEVVGERANGRVRGWRARGEPLPSRVSFSRARFFFCPLLPSACYAG